MKSFLKKLFFISIELAIIAGGLWYIAEKKGIKNPGQIMPAIESTIQEAQEKMTPFPDLGGPGEKSFSWEYRGTKYNLSLTLHQKVYEYYQSQPKKYSYVGELPLTWKDEYYAMFLKSNESDKTISDLASKLQATGKQHKLTNDQIVDLTLAFVQSIAYDDAKAENILSDAGDAEMNFPYETLWEQKGVCSDKSILAYALLREMGYGAALFAYEQNKHMAVAVECPQNYSTYGSGYCYAETTSTGNKIGIIPSIDAGSNRTIDLSSYSPDKIQQLNLQELGEVTILDAASGNQYSGIKETQKISNEINQLKKSMENLLPEIKSQKKDLSEKEDDLEDMQDDLEKYEKDMNIEKYNSTAEKFNDSLEKYKKALKKYNANIELYNQNIQRYNVLIKQ